MRRSRRARRGPRRTRTGGRQSLRSAGVSCDSRYLLTASNRPQRCRNISHMRRTCSTKSTAAAAAATTIVLSSVPTHYPCPRPVDTGSVYRAVVNTGCAVGFSSGCSVVPQLSFSLNLVCVCHLAGNRLPSSAESSSLEHARRKLGTATSSTGQAVMMMMMMIASIC